jgi:hypothetical protein
MSDKFKDVFPLVIGALVGLFVYLYRKRQVAPSGVQELNVIINEIMNINTDASLLVGEPGVVVIDDSVNILTDASLSVTAPSPPPGEVNVTVNDGVNISTSASLSVA